MRYKPLQAAPEDPRLGRFIPEDDRHLQAFPFSVVAPRAIDMVEKMLYLPSWHWTHDQGYEGSCVGHGVAFERAITNSTQNKVLLRVRPFNRRYDPLDIWNEAKKVDEWADTNPGDDNGTSVRAAYDVMRRLGPRRVKLNAISISTDGHPIVKNPEARDPKEGVATNRWGRNSDDIRTAISMGIPVTIGVNWYSAFDRPTQKPGSGKSELWIGLGDLGKIRGGHCVCLYGASDKRQAFRMKNSWGRDYPLVWLPYTVMDRLLDEWGEAAIITDR